VQAIARSTQTVPRTQTQRREESIQRIIDTAFRLIAKGGVKALSLASVGEAAGCSRELPRYHFGSKDAFVEALIDDCAQYWGERLRPPRDIIEEQPLLALLDRLHATYADAEATRGRLLLIFELAGTDNPRLSEKVNATHAATRHQIVALLKNQIATGEISRDIDPEAVAALLNGVYRGIGYQWVMSPESIDLDAALDQLRKLFLRAVSPPLKKAD